MNSKRHLCIMVIGLFACTIIEAQNEPKLTVKPSGRILFDAAYVNSKLPIPKSLTAVVLKIITQQSLKHDFKLNSNIKVYEKNDDFNHYHDGYLMCSGTE